MLFSCSVAALDRYFRELVTQDIRGGLGNLDSLVNSVLIVRAVSREGRQGIGELVEQRVTSRSAVALFLGQLDSDDFAALAIDANMQFAPRSAAGRTVGWAGKSRVATIFGPKSRQQSVDTNV
jgi:hypothetical protein